MNANECDGRTCARPWANGACCAPLGQRRLTKFAGRHSPGATGVSPVPCSERRLTSCGPNRRRGAIAALFSFFLLISVLVGALALNWSYLVTVQRHMQRMADVMALCGASQLTDEAPLRGQPSDPSTCLEKARAEVNRFRCANNEGATRLMQVDEADVTITPGHVPDLCARLEDRQFIESAPYNTLKVTILRARDGEHPVAHLINGFWSAEPVDVAATSLAALDDQVIGFRPTTESAAPLLPLAISEEAWNAALHASHDGVCEVLLRLKSADPACSKGANGAIVDFGGVTIDYDKVQQQVACGVQPGDLSGGQLGPVGPGPAPTKPGPLTLPATQDSPGGAVTSALAADFDAVAHGPHPRRALAVYRKFDSGQVDLVGFVAVRVLQAEEEDHGTNPQQRLTVKLEPCRLIHTTAWTSCSAACHNPYIAKLRLLQ